MTSSQVQSFETPPMSADDIEALRDENGLIDGKFKTVADMVNSYKQLEGKLGAVEQTQTEKPTEEAETPDSEWNPTEIYGDGLASVLEEVGIDPQDISDRFAENDEISEDDYSKLSEAGFSKQIVDTYLDGLRNAGMAGEVDAQGIRDSVGGDESYQQMVSWAIENLPADDVKAFNKLTDTGDGPAIKLAVQGIYSQYNNAMGVEPSLYSGRASTSGPTPFRSTAEVVTAMSDPRWEKDVSYTENVKARLAGSNVFGNG